MSWQERGGPRVTVPASTGFGHVVIGQMAEAAVQGKVEIVFEESGLSWKLSSPVKSTLEFSAILQSGLVP